MTAFLQLVNKIQSPARQLTKLVPAFVSVFTAAERLMELEEDPLEVQGEPIELDGPCGIRLRHVDYRYDDGDREILKDLSFDFYPGSCTAILGETGAGKTTLVRMLLALELDVSFETVSRWLNRDNEKLDNTKGRNALMKLTGLSNDELFNTSNF